MEEVFDIVILGFEAAALSLAIALHELPEQLKVLILEPKPRFSWAGNNCPLPGARMKTSLLQDLVTPRNPSSDFTFVNYLWSTGSLVDYANLSLINPPKRVFSHYLQHAASKLEARDLVRYNQVVSSLRAVDSSEATVTAWRINVQDAADGAARTFVAKRVVIAVPPEPTFPDVLRGVKSNARVFHAVRYEDALSAMRREAMKTLDIALLGGNDEAVEIFEHLSSVLPQANIRLYLDQPTLRQTDDNPFLVNAVQQPGRLPHELQSSICAQATAGSGHQTIDSASVTKLYLERYKQLMRDGDSKTHKSQICTLKSVVNATTKDNEGAVALDIKDVPSGQIEARTQFDYVIAASGYQRTEHKRLMSGLNHLLDSANGDVTVDNNYRANFKRGVLAADVGVWIVDSAETSGPDVFTYLALRTERMLQSLLSSGDPRAGQSQAAGHCQARATL